MDQDLKRHSICEGISDDILKLKYFQEALDVYLNDSAAICEKSDDCVSFSFSGIPRSMKKTNIISRIKEIMFWIVPGIPGCFILKIRREAFRKKNRIVHNAFLFGIYSPLDVKESGYMIKTRLASDQHGWFTQISIGNISGDSVQGRYDLYRLTNITIFEEESKTLNDLRFDDSRLATLQIPLKRVVLQELSKKSQEIITSWKKDAVFSLKFQQR